MKKLQNYILYQMVSSKKFWYAIASVVVPAIVTYLGVSDETANDLFYALIALLFGQSFADFGKESKKK